MSLRDKIENVLRAWHEYEVRRGAQAIIDFDCSPSAHPVLPVTSRLEVYRELYELRQAVTNGDQLAVRLDADLAYLGAMLGQRPGLSDYVRATQGCGARGWSRAYVSERGDIARAHLKRLGIGWSKDTDDDLRQLERPLTPEEAAETIRLAAAELEPLVRKVTNTSAPYRLSIETTDVDAYWAYWLDGAGSDVRLRLNLRNAKFTEVRARQFALHEVLGHGLQSASLAARCQEEDVSWVRLLSVHAPYQVMLEGLAQVMPLFVTPDDAALEARVRLDHYAQLVRAELCTWRSTTEPPSGSASTTLAHACRTGPMRTSATNSAIGARIPCSARICGLTRLALTGSWPSPMLTLRRFERCFMRHTGNHSPRPISSPCGRLDLLSEEPAALFVYGSLRFPEVLRVLLDRVPANKPAAVTGWRVAALRDHVYPALVPADTNATGQLLTDLSRAEWQVLDAFEDDLYDLTRLTLNDGHHGWAYVSDANAAVLSEDWNAAEFTNRELRSYVERCRRWRRWFEQQPLGEQVS